MSTNTLMMHSVWNEQPNVIHSVSCHALTIFHCRLLSLIIHVKTSGSTTLHQQRSHLQQDTTHQHVCVCGAVGKVNELFTPQTPSQITSSILTLSPVWMDNKKKHLKEHVELKHRGGDPGFHKQDVFFKIKMSTCTQHSSGFYQILSAKFPAFLQNCLFYFNSVSPQCFLV